MTYYKQIIRSGNLIEKGDHIEAPDRPGTGFHLVKECELKQNGQILCVVSSGLLCWFKPEDQINCLVQVSDAGYISPEDCDVLLCSNCSRGFCSAHCPYHDKSCPDTFKPCIACGEQFTPHKRWHALCEKCASEFYQRAWKAGIRPPAYQDDHESKI